MLKKGSDGLKVEPLERRSAPLVVSIESDSSTADSDPTGKSSSPPCKEPAGGGGDRSGKHDVQQP